MDLRLFFDNFDVIAAAPNGVKKLRQAILQLAVRGGLSDSRKNNLFKTGKVSDFVKVLNGYAFKSEWFL
jgi:type I restriction enzyme, S subunit